MKENLNDKLCVCNTVFLIYFLIYVMKIEKYLYFHSNKAKQGNFFLLNNTYITDLIFMLKNKQSEKNFVILPNILRKFTISI